MAQSDRPTDQIDNTKYTCKSQSTPVLMIVHFP